MAAKSTVFAGQLLANILNNAAISDVGDATGLRGSTAAGDLFVGLHTADPTAGGDQTASEATWTGYARVAVSRAGASWTVTGDEAENASAITFGACTSGSGTMTFFSVGTAASGAGKVLYRGALTAPLAVSAGITPQFGAGQLTITEE
jgi:hypothetical protein